MSANAWAPPTRLPSSAITQAIISQSVSRNPYPGSCRTNWHGAETTRPCLSSLWMQRTWRVQNPQAPSKISVTRGAGVLLTVERSILCGKAGSAGTRELLLAATGARIGMASTYRARQGMMSAPANLPAIEQRERNGARPSRRGKESSD